MKNKKHLGTKTAISLLLILSLVLLISGVIIISFLIPSNIPHFDGPNGLEKETLPTGQSPLTDPEAQWDDIRGEKEGDLFFGYRKDALNLLSKMTTEEKVGQLFLLSYDNEKAIEQLQTVFPAGYIMAPHVFDDETPESIFSDIQSLQEYSRIPLFFAVNEEGGEKVSISDKSAFIVSAYLSPSEIYENFGINGVTLDTLTKCTFLKDLGINLNFAPVCDISTDPNSFIYNRTLKQSAEITADYISAVVSTMNSCNLSSVIMHFPGYGNTNGYENGDKVVINTPLDSLKNNDFLPFFAGIEAKCPAILLSHILCTSIDEQLPASLSEATVDLLRNEFGFSGVIICDDISLKTLENYSLNENSAVLAVKAGANLIIAKDNFTDYYNAVLTATKENIISEAELNNAVYRVLQWKLYSSLVN